MQRLTEKVYWNDSYRRVQLPRLIDTRGYSNFRFDNYFKSTLKSELMNKKFLEVGCGASAWLVYFAKEFHCDVSGVDYSKLGCKLAEENLRLNKVKGNITCEDVFNLNPSKIGKFDIIFSAGVVEHFDDPSKMLKIMNDLLEPNGIVIVSVPNIKGIYGIISKHLHRAVYEKHMVISKEDMASYLKKAGFKHMESTYFGTFNLGVIGWGNQPSLPMWFVKFLLIPVVFIFNKMIGFILRSFKIEIESKFFSPYVLGVGRKTQIIRGS
jgi:2-polyprenyl-3-methyl-5-hydroxy-6-metoxy-1,4-benzoquinol methylase